MPLRLGVLLAVALVLSACAPGANEAAVDAAADAPGFLLGLWHGFIAPITFLISLFSDEVGIYEVANSGAWYDFGFMIGVTSVFGGSAGSRRMRRS